MNYDYKWHFDKSGRQNRPDHIYFLMNFRYHNTMKKYLPCVLGLQDSFMKARDSLDMVHTCSCNLKKMHIHTHNYDYTCTCI